MYSHVTEVALASLIFIEEEEMNLVVYYRNSKALKGAEKKIRRRV